jgi:general secretion pathway protein B
MSSILEALKKLEEEKSARRSGMGNLAGKVAKPGRRTRQRSTLLVAGGMLAVAVVSVLVTYIAMNGFSTHRSVRTTGKEPTETSRPGGAEQVPLAAPAPLRDTVSQSGPAHYETIQAIPAPREAPASISRKPVPPVSAGRQISSPPPLDARGQENLALHPERPTPGKPLPSLTVSGIAWQKDNVDRMAVVNATSVREGSTVEGAVVREILPDRVRFSVDGRDVEVFLEK